MLKVHHLGRSQSERIVWLCEELDIPYELIRYARAPLLAPAEYKELHPIGTAPIITDGDLVLSESGAIVQYIVSKHGGGRLALADSHPDFAQFLFWFHFANGTLQANMFNSMVLAMLNLAEDHPRQIRAKARLDNIFSFIDARAGEAPFFAGDEFTSADVMMGFPLTTMRYFLPRDLTPYPNIRAYLQRIGHRPAYRRAMQKGDPEMVPLLS